jgi:hypothetical protein
VIGGILYSIGILFLIWFLSGGPALSQRDLAWLCVTCRTIWRF